MTKYDGRCPICGTKLEVEDSYPAKYGPARFLMICEQGHKIIEKWELKENGDMEFLEYEVADDD